MIDSVSCRLCVDNFEQWGIGWRVQQNLHRLFIGKKPSLGYWPGRGIPDTTGFGAQIPESIGHQTYWNQSNLGAFTLVCQ